MSRSHLGFAAVLCLTVAVAPLPAAAGADSTLAPDWLSAAQRQVAHQEYEVSWQLRSVPDGVEASWQAPNREQGFRTYFGREGIRLVPRVTDQAPWEWGLELTGYGRGNRLWQVEETQPLPDGNRVDYGRGRVVEWYVNEPRGLKQGFTLWGAPDDNDPDDALLAAAGQAATGGRPERPAYLELTLSGSLEPSMGRDGQAIEFRTGRGVGVVRYTGLKVNDATGRELTSWMELLATPGERRIRLLFDDDGALYPLTVDPLVTDPSWTVDGDQAGARFGQSVAGVGDVDGDECDDLVVGAPGYDNGEADEGRVYLFLGCSLDGLDTEPAWIAEGDQAGAEFGYSVAGAGDVDGDGCADVVVGAPGYDDDEADEGRAYLYLGCSPNGLATEPAWTAEGGQAGAAFGYSVAGAGDVDGDGYDVAVGAPLYDVAGDEETLTDAGRVYVYHGPAMGEPWTAEGEQAYEHFGDTVASAGDVDGSGHSDLAVGAPLYDGAETDAGRALVYYGSAGGLDDATPWTHESDQAYARFGHSLGTAGDVNCDGIDDFIVGAFHYANGEAGEGQAYVFHGGLSAELPDSPNWTAEGDQAWAYFGAAVATAGDLDGDGCSEVVVGAYGYNTSRTDGGRIYVYSGSSSGLSEFPARFVDGSQSYSGFGEVVASAGDVNDDGFADVVIGTPSYFGDEGSESGQAAVHHGAEPSLTRTLYSTLGDAPPFLVEEGEEEEEDVYEEVDVDEDIFIFEGTETEQITITLDGGSGEGRANLFLMDDMGDDVELFEVDRTELPNQISVVLPASGEYFIAVTEQPDLVILPGPAFMGDYSLTLDSSLGASATLEPDDSVESAWEEPTTLWDGAEERTDRTRRPARRLRIDRTRDSLRR